MSSSVTSTSAPATATSSTTVTSQSSSELPSSARIVSAAELAAPVSPSSAALAPPPLLDEQVRLWVGNIQPKVAEYQLLRLAQPAGTITKFDFMLHGAGPQAGRPRGYAFLSYSTHREAEVARRRLTGATLAGARLVCRWANEQTLPGDARKEEPAAAPALALEPSAATSRRPPSAQAQIRAIEAKLQHMGGGGGGGVGGQRFSVAADSERTDVRRLPRVRGPLSWVNRDGLSRQAAQQPKPYSRRRW